MERSCGLHNETENHPSSTANASKIEWICRQEYITHLRYNLWAYGLDTESDTAQKINQDQKEYVSLKYKPDLKEIYNL
jgi:hypothetical protein